MQRDVKSVVIVTGASSGVGLHATKALVDRGWYVVMACRDLAKAEVAASGLGISADRVSLELIDLGSQASVHAFVARFGASGLPLHALVCNAAVYLPLLKQPARSPEGYEISVATNHFGHFLLSRLLLPTLVPLRGQAPRLITLGTVTANSEEFGGKVPIPAPADLGDLEGLEAGFREPVAMIDGKPFKAGKAYKDSADRNFKGSAALLCRADRYWLRDRLLKRVGRGSPGGRGALYVRRLQFVPSGRNLCSGIGAAKRRTGSHVSRHLLGRSGVVGPIWFVPGNAAPTHLWTGSSQLSLPREGHPISLNLSERELTIGLRASQAVSSTDVVLVAFLHSAVTSIGRGENAGRKINEVNIVRSIRTLGRWEGKDGESIEPGAVI